MVYYRSLYFLKISKGSAKYDWKCPWDSNVSRSDIAELFGSETSRNRASHDEHVVRENKNADEERRREDVCMIFLRRFSGINEPLRKRSASSPPQCQQQNASLELAKCFWIERISSFVHVKRKDICMVRVRTRKSTSKRQTNARTRSRD